MLRESEVISAVCLHLESRGYKVLSRCGETEQGDDIVAVLPDGKTRVLIEAKGETSSKAHTARFGKVFSSAQVRDHVANAFYRAAQFLANGQVSAMALPGNEAHRACINKISVALKELEIEVFWVSPEGVVTVAGHWPATRVLL